MYIRVGMCGGGTTVHITYIYIRLHANFVVVRKRSKHFHPKWKC